MGFGAWGDKAPGPGVPNIPPDAISRPPGCLEHLRLPQWGA